MKQIAAICLLAATAFSCQNDQSVVKTHLELANLKGSVRMVDKTVHNAEAKSVCPAADKLEANQSTYVYNKSGNLEESSMIDPNGRVTEVSKYIYNKRGRCIGIDKFTGDTKTGREVPVLDGGKMTELKVYDRDNTNIITYRYVYSGDDISVTRTIDREGNESSSVTNEYVNGELVSQTERDGNGDIKSISRFVRNPSNDVTEYIISVPKNNEEYRFNFEYEYDEAGNWVRQTQYYDGRIVNIVIRNITYFEV